ncbi:winged helix-turn-helix domain-containing protein [Serratia fonticola]|uniref:winged helix-turn-helix domain-containing protein n=1 Tax=Serratia fonticola TaxID=47917 RepID=UPI000E2C5869|nr:helix-turn-helix domain-containing protein [Serratia fonticola]RDL27140.1 transcriptional regulator [Serratia fonticola]
MRFNEEVSSQIYMEMKHKLFGFLLHDSIIYNIASRRLLYFSEDLHDHAMSVKTVILNETQSRLLICLLENCKKAVIYKDDIMKSVWDEFNLPSSNQRLWQTINELKKKLLSIGLPDDFITNIHGMGYSVHNSKIGLLHIS